MQIDLRTKRSPVKILLAPQAFKGSISALSAGQAMERGIKRALPQADVAILPIADGGDGTVEALVNATHGKFRKSNVTDPLGRQTSAKWGILGDKKTAIIEMSVASGLRLVEPDKRDPLITTTYGTGELIKAALDEGCKRLIIGIGGSATNDGGAGAAQALGVRLLDANGHEIGWGGAALINLATIDTSDLDPRLRNVEVLVASDVTNPLVGPEGASYIYGPQKGASPEMVRLLDRALQHFGQVISKQLGVEIRGKPGAGAAGGLGGGLMAFLNASITPGAQLIMQALGIDQYLDGVDLVFTGEGQIDGQTIYGKAPVALAQAAKKHNLPVIAVVGAIAEGYDAVYKHGIDAVLSIVSRPMDMETAMDHAETLIEDASERAIRLFMVGVHFKKRGKLQN